MTVVAASGLRKGFPGPPEVQVLRALDLTVDVGERVAIRGRSGAGKSTLLNLLGLLDSADAGSYKLCGQDAGLMPRRQRDRLRSEEIGFVFQASHIIGHRTAAQNLDLKLGILNTPVGDRDAMIRLALGEVGMAHRRDTLGRLLSGGEKQRLAFARAIIAGPSLILADEPTGNLDDQNSVDILGLLTREAERGAAVVVITHDQGIGAWADRSLLLDDGLLSETR